MTIPVNNLHTFMNPYSRNNIIRRRLITLMGEIANPIDLETEPLWKTDIWRLRLAFHRHVIGEFWRGLSHPEADKLYPIDRFMHKMYKDWVKYEADLWLKIWLTLEKVSELFPQVQAPEQVFIKIIVEQKLVHLSLNFTEPIEDGIPCAKEMVRVHQQENKALREYINPFLEQESPFTFAFIGQVMSMAESDSTFAKQYYKPIVKARTELQDFIVKNNPARYLPNPVTGRLEKYDKRTPQKVSKPPKSRSR